jgi:hypothetical protein
MLSSLRRVSRIRLCDAELKTGRRGRKNYAKDAKENQKKVGLILNFLLNFLRLLRSFAPSASGQVRISPSFIFLLRLQNGNPL